MNIRTERQTERQTDRLTARTSHLCGARSGLPQLCYKAFHHFKYLPSRLYSCFSERELDRIQHRALLCCNHTTYCLFESTVCAKQENLSRLKKSLFLQELLPFVLPRILCRVSSKDNFEAKKSPRRIRFVCTIVYYGTSLCCSFCFYFYKPLM